MSRYELPLSQATIDARVATSLAIGWDPPLDTYFLQLLHVDEEQDETLDVLWLGTSYQECQDVDRIIEIAGHYSGEAAAHREKLLADRERQGARGRPALFG